MKATSIVVTLITLSSVYLLANGSLTWGKMEGNFGRNYHSPQSLQVSNQVNKKWISGYVVGSSFSLSKDEMQLFESGPVSSLSSLTGKTLWGTKNFPCGSPNSIDVMPGSGQFAFSCEYNRAQNICVAGLVDQQSGKLLWSNFFYNCVAIDSTVGPNDVIYVTTQSGFNTFQPYDLNITALKDDGTEIFSQTVSTGQGYFWFRAPLVTNDGLVLLVADNSYWYALSSADGSRMWKLDSRSTAAIVYPNNVPTMLTVAVRHLTSVNPMTGAVNWQQVVSDLIPLSSLFISYTNSTGVVHWVDWTDSNWRSTIMAFDLQTGRELWRQSKSSPSPNLGMTIATDANNQIYRGYDEQIDVLTIDGQIMTSINMTNYSNFCSLHQIIPASSNRLYVNCYSYLIALDF